MAKIIPVSQPPSWGCPEDSSNTEPTAAIAATQDPPKYTPLFGVITIVKLSVQLTSHSTACDCNSRSNSLTNGLDCLSLKAMFCKLLVQRQAILDAIDEQNAV